LPRQLVLSWFDRHMFSANGIWAKGIFETACQRAKRKM
jgi:hypothetical protein